MVRKGLVNFPDSVELKQQEEQMTKCEQAIVDKAKLAKTTQKKQQLLVLSL